MSIKVNGTKQINDLTAATSVTGAESMIIEGTGGTRKVGVDVLKNYIAGDAVTVSDHPYILNVGTAITASADLDSYTTPGTYSADSTVISSITNAPTTTTTYKLVVEQIDTNIVRQTAITVGAVYQRVGDNSTSTWEWAEWVKSVTNIDYATSSIGGVVKIDGNGIKIDSSTHVLSIDRATDLQCKTGTATTKPIVTYNQHLSVFYGLAKAAGDTTQVQSNNAIGTYTADAKTAIRSMLGVPSTNDIPTNVSDLTNDANYVTNTDYATNEVGGVIKVNNGDSSGLMVDNGFIRTLNSSASMYKTGTSTYRTVNIEKQHIATFYGLAKAAGDTTQSLSENSVGIYTNSAKAAIRSMLGAVGNTDYASTSNPGIGKISEYYGVSIIPSDTTGGGTFCTSPATDSAIKTGTTPYRPIVPAKQHAATFYGLAKAAGDSTQASSSNAVGTYTDDAKAAIRSMIGAAGNFGVYVGSTQPTDPNIVVWIDTDDSANIDGTWEGGSY